MPRPRPVILDNGDVLAPVKKIDGDCEMVRVPVGAPKHADWVLEAQGQKRPTVGTGIGVVVGLVIPIIGIIFSIVWFANGRTGAALAVLLATAVGVMLNLTLIL